MASTACLTVQWRGDSFTTWVGRGRWPFLLAGGGRAGEEGRRGECRGGDNHHLFRIIARVFGIFAEEVLGYHTKLFVMDQKELSFDFATQFSRLSTCSDPL